MVDIYFYLVFENVKEVMVYYVEQFDVDIVVWCFLIKVQVDSYGLELMDLDEIIVYGEFMIVGQIFICVDVMMVMFQMFLLVLIMFDFVDDNVVVVDFFDYLVVFDDQCVMLFFSF